MGDLRNIQKVESYIDELEVKASGDVISTDDIIVHHRKRDYLFVNTLQGKHVPVNPDKVFNMVEALVDQIMVHGEVKDAKRLSVIGFAETATGLGNIVDMELEKRLHKPDILVMQTTREPVTGVNIVDFEEEHSHATSQKLIVKNGDFLCRAADTDCLILVEDEITTGKTVINLISKLREKLYNPDIKIIVASICNWQSDEDKQRFIDNGIDAVSLISGKIKDTNIKMSEVDDKAEFRPAGDNVINCLTEKEVAECYIDASLDSCNNHDSLYFCERRGHTPYRVKGYAKDKILELAKQIGIKEGTRVRVVGNEEFMGYPLLFSKVIQEELGCKVKFHAITRSPIDITVDNNGLGLVNGVKLLKKIKETDKLEPRYLYNLDNDQDVVLVVSDKPLDNTERVMLASWFKVYGVDLDNLKFLVIY